MPARFTPFVNDQFYHIYNRGAEKKTIFQNKRDYSRFLKTFVYYHFEGPKPKFSNFYKYKLFKPNPQKKIVDIICYCLMPNHFHFLVRQLKEGGISEFVAKLTNSYTKYYNTKYDRVGALLQGQFKAVLVESDEQLLHLSRYIHLNPISSFLVKKLADYQFSSYPEYINSTKDSICSKEVIMSFFKFPAGYRKFVSDQISYAQNLELIKHKLIDEDLY